jgi:hypothetical protein
MVEAEDQEPLLNRTSSSYLTVAAWLLHSLVGQSVCLCYRKHLAGDTPFRHTASRAVPAHRARQGKQGRPGLPAPDIKGSLSLASKSGKVALVNSIAALTCSTPCLPNPSILDFVGYGSANSFEGIGAATRLSTSTAALRKEGGCVDTDKQHGRLHDRRTYPT